MHIEQTDSGYMIAFATKYTFGDTVSYFSEYNGSGSGQIVSIDVDAEGVIRYTLLLPDDSWQPGILESEILHVL